MGIGRTLRNMFGRKSPADKTKYVAENAAVAMIHEWVYRYPHGYFIRRANKYITFKRK